MRFPPRLIKGLEKPATKLKQLSLSNRTFDESWLQELIYNNPGLLPAGEIDSNYSKLIPLGREISTPSGSIDNLYVTPKGNLCLVETKLWRNPEAHRTVLAQLIDYAKNLASFTYEELESKVKQFHDNRKKSFTSIVDLVKDGKEEFDAVLFEEELRRSMAIGEFLLLIVGDQIRPQVVMLSQAVQAAPHLEFKIGLVELRFYHLDAGEWPLVVVPSLVGQTVEVTRGVIRIRYEKKKPGVEVAAEERRREGGGQTDPETFLKSLPEEMEEVFRPFLERWLTGPWYIYWGTAGFSLRLRKGVRYYTVFDAYPGLISTFKKEWLKDWSQAENSYQSYRDQVMKIPAVNRVIIQGKRYVNYRDITPEDLQILLSATDKLVRDLAKLTE